MIDNLEEMIIAHLNQQFVMLDDIKILFLIKKN